ncbi:cubilin homolog isoform X2 [Episyrphus balteatus]|uniref:cubilin homolog isoform X2 n=1 Tax=Episyrphus balteatus TaxID=286459 RepID=UPI0024861BE0|nr:cubilin homolog isoform X2 [Episyrphus balteatus]
MILKSDEWVLLALVCFLSFLLGVNSSIEKSPKIITTEGNVILEAGINKNITIRLNGRSRLLVNDYDLMALLVGERSWLTNTSSELPIGGSTLRILQEDVQFLKSRLLGRRGLNARLNRLLNRTQISNPANVLRRTQRRLTTLENRVQSVVRRLERNYCKSNPCDNGGTCIDLFDDFLCKCQKGFEGTTCSTDVNECALFVGTDLGCQNGAQCINQFGSYSCICTSGWQGMHCSQRKTDCLHSSNTELCGHGTCVNINDNFGYRCICEQGWTTNGLTPACSVDVDECKEYSSPCSTKCINLPGSYMCAPCEAGFTGNGLACRDLDECAINNGGCSINPFVACINSYGSFHCGECPIGWSGDGRICTRTAGASCSNNNICHPTATCSEVANSIVCTCPLGMIGNGVGPSGCRTSGNDLCSPNPCMNGGTCMDNGSGSYQCICQYGFKQPNCQPLLNPCVMNPCRNGGTCRAHGSNFTCDCVEGYGGRLCATQRSRCGQFIAAEQGNLKYPLTSLYNHNTKCSWVIRTNETKVLNITFANFDFEDSVDCRFDWLQIHDGQTVASQLIGRFCGSTAPLGGHIITTTNSIYLWFKSDNSTAKAGFELFWTSIDPVCGGVKEFDSHVTIASPGSPGNYPRNRDCRWHLKAPNNKRIKLVFFSLNIEKHADCDHDYVEITDAVSGSRLEIFCNSSNPSPFTLPSNEIIIHFHSDNEGNDVGFQIHASTMERIPGCGGTYTDRSGQITSPVGFQGPLSCEYIVRYPLGLKIQLNVVEFNMGDEDCLEIFDVNSSGEKISTGRWCGKMNVPVFKSTGNAVQINYSSKGGTFKLSYGTICEYTFEDPTGTITSPNYPSLYPSDEICIYEIIGEAHQIVSLEFEVMDLESHEGIDYCWFDYIIIADGNNQTAAGPYCGKTIPPRIVTNTSLLTLTMRSDSTNAGKGFKAHYALIDTSKNCGGLLRKSSGIIKLPSDQGLGTYKNDLTCTWNIMAPEGYGVQITWESFRLEQSNDCLYDYLEIFDTDQITSEVTPSHKFCGSNLPPALVSASNIVTLKFTSDSTDTEDGFVARYSFVDVSSLCGGIIFSSTGQLKSPNWPNEYPKDVNCSWTISVKPGHQIELLTKTFDLEDSENCTNDWLEIRNGGSASSPIIGTYCGQTIPSRIPSFTHQIYLTFKSNSQIVRSGFRLQWQIVSLGCGGVLASDHGSVASPFYPQNYGNDVQCEWRISVSKGSTISLVIEDLSLESLLSCSFDFVEIFDGPTAEKRKIGRYCEKTENTPMSIETTSSDALIRFQTDSSNSDRGFYISYSSDCNRILNATHGSIESPNFGDKNPNKVNCTWIIQAPPGNPISMEFAIVGKKDTSTKQDYIYVIDGNNTVIRLNEAKRLESNSSQVQIVLNSTSIYFSMEYAMRGCIANFHRPTGEFTSPGYPNPYTKNTGCRWQIETTIGKAIELVIEEIDLEVSTNCTKDHIEIWNTAQMSHSIGKFCGKRNNITITSSGPSLYVQFISDNYVNGRGFKAKYKTIDSKCGGNFVLSNGVISSPNYPHNYDSNLHCEWYVEVSQHSTMTLTLEELDLEDSYECSMDALKIYHSKEIEGNQPWKNLCGEELPKDNTFQTTSNSALIVFDTDADTEFKGFKISFKENCGKRIVVNDTGRIRLERSDQKECLWVFVAEDETKHVTLTTTHVRLRPWLTILNITDDCDGVLIYDGDFSNTTSINPKQKFCYKHPPAVTSLGHALTMKIETEFVFELEVYYSIMDNNCGGSFDSLHGTFASPSYPNSYPINIECIWEIKASVGNWLSLKIQQMDIENSQDCNSDYLEVREGSSIGRLVGVFCGDDIPNPLLGFESLWIKFRSDNDNVRKGFLADYSYALNNELNGMEGIIESPRYPSFMVSLSHYSWRISVPRGNLIMLTVDYMYRLQSQRNIKFFNGYDDQAEPILLGESNIIRSDTNYLYIKSHSGIFRLHWYRVSKEFMATNKTTIEDPLSCANTILNIGSVSTIFQSPGYPEGYESNLNCNWTLVPIDPGSHAVVSFQKIELEDQADCLADSVIIYSSTDMTNWNELRKTCKMKSDSVLQVSGDKFLRVQFLTDFGVNKTGFTATASSMCGSTLTEPTGIINATKYGTFVGGLQSPCVWKIQVKTGRRIKITFLELEFKSRTDGNALCQNYILLKNGISEHSPNLGTGKYCESNIPDIPITSSNAAYVKLNIERISSDPSRISFKYEEIMNECMKNIELNDNQRWVIVNSENYPNIPHPHTMCVWNIKAPIHRLLAVDFVDSFNLKQSEFCDSEYVELNDGSTQLSPVIGRFCGKSTPDTQYSSGNRLRITFFTDIAEPSTGFKVNVSLGVCGGTYRQRNGTISIPKLMSYHVTDKNFSCDYMISIPYSFSVNLTLDSMNFPWSDNCSEVNHLIVTPIYDEEAEETASEPIIMCGESSAKTYIFDTNNVRISYRIVSNEFNNDAFSFSYLSLGNRCDHLIESESGVLKSPGYIYLMTVPMRCKWKIKVPKGRRVKVDFLDYQIDSMIVTNSTNPNNLRFPGWLSVFNDFDSKSIIARYSSRSPPPPVIYSTDNLMSFVSIEVPKARKEGFKIRFSSDEESLYCNENFDQTRGDIHFRTSQNISIFCRYNIDLNPYETFALTVNDIKINTAILREYFNCLRNSPLTVQDMSETQKMQWFCGNRNDSTIRLPYPIMFDISSNIYNNLTSLDLTFARHKCGGVYTIGNQFQLNEPVVSTSNYGVMDCAWRVLPNPGDVDQFEISLSVDFKLKCDEEYLMLFSDSKVNSPHLGRFCNQATVSNVVSIKSLFIEYHTSNYQNASKFNLTAVPGTGCGGELSYPFRLIDFRKQYQNNVECIWTVNVKKEYHIAVLFSGRFFIESSPNCTKDYLLIQEEAGGEWRDIQRICGREPPPFVNITTNVMRLIFRSDESGLGDGFTVNFTRNCGGIFYASKDLQQLSSPNYPLAYDSNSYCNYTIYPSEPDKNFLIQFKDFLLETSPVDGCLYDKLTVYVDSNEPAVLCGSKDNLEFRSNKPITLVFKSDGTFNRKGFSLEFGEQTCGGKITTNSVIATPKQRSDNKYPSNAVCLWNITAPVDKKIVVKFEKFEFEGSYACTYDYVEVFSGKLLVEDQRLAKLCGNLTGVLPHLSIKSNMAMIQSVSDQSEPSVGFEAIITFVKKCDMNVTLRDTKETVYTLDTFANGYENNLNCEILFTTEPGHQLLLEFSSFHTEESTNCDRDYVRVLDGAGPFADEIGKFCGHIVPNAVVSSRSSMFVNFVTDSADTSTGFMATVKVMPLACGAHELFLHPNETKAITIGSDGGNYLPNLNCLWRIRSDSNIRLDFEKIDIQGPDAKGACTTDYLKIYNKQYSVVESVLGSDIVFNGNSGQPYTSPYDNTDNEHVYCGQGVPGGYFTNNQEVFVKFFSDSTIEKSGFKLIATSSSGCLKNYTSNQGRILMETSADCNIYINAPQNYSISLYFNYFYMFFASSDTTTTECSSDYIEVFDEQTKPSKSIRKICGSIDPSNSIFAKSNKIRMFMSQSGHYNNYDVTFLASDKGPGCGGDLYNYAGVITSPFYPENSRNNSDCQWNIRVPNNLAVALEFKVFDMGSKVTCHSDYLEILERKPSNNQEMEVMRKFCGEDLPMSYIGRQNTLSIRFRKTVNFDGTGWVIRFSGVRQRFNLI